VLFKLVEDDSALQNLVIRLWVGHIGSLQQQDQTAFGGVRDDLLGVPGDFGHFQMIDQPRLLLLCAGRCRSGGCCDVGVHQIQVIVGVAEEAELCGSNQITECDVQLFRAVLQMQRAQSVDAFENTHRTCCFHGGDAALQVFCFHGERGAVVRDRVPLSKRLCQLILKVLIFAQEGGSELAEDDRGEEPKGWFQTCGREVLKEVLPPDGLRRHVPKREGEGG